MFRQIIFVFMVASFAARAPLAVAQGEHDSDDAAKQLFYKMEDRLSRATSLTCSLKLKFEGTGEPGGPLMKRELTGSMAVADGKRVRFELNKTAAEPSDLPGVHFWLTVSDGKRTVHEDSGTPKPLVHNVAKDEENPLDDYTTLLARSGVVLVTFPLPPVGRAT